MVRVYACGLLLHHTHSHPHATDGASSILCFFAGKTALAPNPTLKNLCLPRLPEQTPEENVRCFFAYLCLDIYCTLTLPILQPIKTAEIILFDDVIVVYKFIGDLMFYVVGHSDENEILLLQVLVGFYDSVSMLLRGAVEKKTVLENLDLVLLSMDELVEGGLVLETDPPTIATRVTMRSGEGDAEGMTMENPGLHSLSAAFGNVKEQLARSLLK